MRGKPLATARLTHAGNLPFPAGRAAPRDRSLLGGIRATTADEGTEREQSNGQEAFRKGRHDSPNQYGRIAFLQDPSQGIRQHLGDGETAADIADDDGRDNGVPLAHRELLPQLRATG